MSSYVVTTSSFNVALLSRLLPGTILEDAKVIDGGCGALSLARSLLARRRVPVAIVTDADTVAPGLVRERRQDVQELLYMVSTPERAKAVMAVPEIELVFFHGGMLERIFGPLSERVMIVSEFAPQRALQELFDQSPQIHDREALLECVTDEDAELMRQAPPLQELIEFLETARHAAELEAIAV